MKIKNKNKLIESKIINESEEDDLFGDFDDDEEEASTTAPTDKKQVAKVVKAETQAAAADGEVSKEGAAELSSQQYTAASAEVAKQADAFEARETVALNVENSLTKALDASLAVARKAKRRSKKGMRGGDANANLLVVGYPGSGKTAVVWDWCKSRGIRPFFLDAKNPDLATVLNGFAVRDLSKAKSNEVTQAYSNALGKLEEPGEWVLFLDELNRQNKKNIRGSLLTLIKDHTIAGPGEGGVRKFDNLLFTIACINPWSIYDPGADKLFDAEKSRFKNTVRFDSTPESANAYFVAAYKDSLGQLDPKDPDFKEDLLDYCKQFHLAKYLTSHPNFRFDGESEVKTINDQNKNMFNQRLLTDGLYGMADAEDFKDWIRGTDSNSADLIDSTKTMLLNILDKYKAPSDTDILANPKKYGYEGELPDALKQELAASQAANAKKKPREDDKSMFTNPGDSSGSKAASGIEVEAELDALVF